MVGMGLPNNYKRRKGSMLFWLDYFAMDSTDTGWTLDDLSYASSDTTTTTSTADLKIKRSKFRKLKAIPPQKRGQLKY